MGDEPFLKNGKKPGYGHGLRFVLFPEEGNRQTFPHHWRNKERKMMVKREKILPYPP